MKTGIKIGIITITNGQNYGNRLQNYALQEVIKELGHRPETIWNDTGSWENLGIYSRFKYWIRSKIHLKYTPRIDRVVKFTRFNRTFIQWSKYKVSNSYIPASLGESYDYFICGSDQIWNPFYSRTSGVDFLSFAECEKKIAYAASLGVGTIEKKHEAMFQKYLKDFPVISVRETQGAVILEKILKRKIPVMPDPTILLTREQWNRIERKPKQVGEKEEYILTYFLNENLQALKDIPKISEMYHCRVISLEDCYTDGNENSYFITMDPAEFLWLISHAKIILTDSFHGCVFSIIYAKKFFVYNRKFKVSMGSRIEQLLHTYQLEDHMIHDENPLNLKILDNSKDINKILNEERKRGIQFLRENLQ